MTEMSDPDRDPGTHHARSPDGVTGWFDRRDNVRRFLGAFFLLCFASMLGELFIHKHTEHPAEKLFGFHAIYAFVGIVVLVLVSKQLRRIVMRADDYYDR